MLSQALGTIICGVITIAIVAYFWIAGGRAERELAGKNHKKP